MTYGVMVDSGVDGLIHSPAISGTGESNTINSQNEETGFGSDTLAYDSNGNLTTDQNGETLIYNAWNQLVACKNGGTTLASYVYDANGNRVQQTESSTTTDQYYSGAGQELEDRVSGTVTAQYVWGLMYINDLVLRDDNSSSGSYGKSSSGLGRRLYAQQDADWNVTALVNTSGTVLERFDYTPYGIATVLSSSWATTTDGYSWLYTYQGMRLDPVTGMMHSLTRDDDVYLGRWVQQDPDGYVNGPDMYQTDGSNPVTYADPSGLSWYNPWSWFVPLGESLGNIYGQARYGTPYQDAIDAAVNGSTAAQQRTQAQLRQVIQDAQNVTAAAAVMPGTGLGGPLFSPEGAAGGLAGDSESIIRQAAQEAGALARDISKAARDALKSGCDAARDALPAGERAADADRFRKIANLQKGPNANIARGFNNARADWLQGTGPWPGNNANAWAKANGVK